MSLDRFKSAQDDPRAGIATALAELRAGRKTSHWIWYVFPQLASLGRSLTAQFYGIKDLDEACAYLRQPVLCERLTEAAEVAAGKLEEGVPLDTLMGSATDGLKLVSSMTLFEVAALLLTARDATPEFSRLLAICKRVLEATELRGVTRCEQTLAECDAQ
jgi:uncharacterized protein (DUF1810 family)